MAGHKPKVSNYVLGVVSIFAIVLIVYFALTFTPAGSSPIVGTESDASGQVTSVVKENALVDTPLCKIIVGMTTIYDDNTLAITLEEGASATYSSSTISVTSINSEGCVIAVDGVSDYLALGQIQRVGSVYVTVKDVLQ